MHGFDFVFRSKAALFAAIGVSALAVSCSAEDPQAELDHSTEAVTVQGSGGAGSINPYNWNSGKSGVDMTATSNSVCFLVGAYGSFVSNDDRVSIVKTTGTPQKWRLHGGTGSGAPRGQALCGVGITLDPPPGADPNGQVGWENEGPKDLGTATNRTCFLTAVWGNFAATGEEIKTEIVGGRWRINGTSAGGRASCVARPTSYPKVLNTTESFIVFSQSGANEVPGAFNNTATNSPWLCALTRASGRLRANGGIFVHQFFYPIGNTFGFEMISHSSVELFLTSPVFGSGACFST